MAQRRESAGRLTSEDWVHAGYAILADHGREAVKLDRLCTRLDVTKGSFYWHFADMAAFRAALVQSWAQLHDRDRRDFDRLDHLAPRERLNQMMTALLGERQWALERAMREWARTDPAVAESVQHADRLVVAAVRRAFVDAGFDSGEADMRAQATFAAGIGFLHLTATPPESQTAAQLERFLDLMLAR